MAVVDQARAQACCGGGSSMAATRLDTHEWLLLGAQVYVSQLYGSHDAQGRFAGAPTQTSQTDLRQELFVTARILERGEVSVVVPALQSFRHVSGESEQGMGVGDIELRVRGEIVRLHEHRGWPSLAVLLGLVAPTGRSIEDAKLPLGSDATGGGVTRFQSGLGLEYALDDWLLGLAALIELPAVRHNKVARTKLGTRGIITLGASYQWSVRWNTALFAGFQSEGEATVAGATVPDTGVRRSQLGLASTVLLDDSWRIRAQLMADPPISQLGRNQGAEIGFALGVVRSWL